MLAERAHCRLAQGFPVEFGRFRDAEQFATA
jgi:hypothetical protein